ncbi:23S rRNA (pseudouridine1915-N3)-methyltransferase [Halanaerobium kushneri]|jgi:23S rRNA (pseudouridine1915-N3)-methyltransferase|uniref:Ribosomal RNA large subunit methyltransferase H n=1 Tax=Halanaerobium kushneri TaxID=56779 RepID=A0A1N6SSF8_9FIRM|nr:23S rRNA (pseudouridine1915-N3)-methyltransferase [Halanaerobium kushneri]
MIEINLMTVGNLKSSFLEPGIEEFKKRLNRYCDLNIIELKDELVPKNPSQKDIAALQALEGERIVKSLPERTYVFALDVKGKPMTSTGFAKSLNNLQVRGYSSFTFIIGGATGLSDFVLQQADYRFSLSHMTFTHQMIRLLLLEQIYRAFKINNNEPYHL